MKFYALVLGLLAVWRITHLLNAEDGPGDVAARLRRAAGAGFLGAALDCFNCLSLWVAAPFAAGLGDGLGERLLLWPALSGGAILLERLTAPAPAVPIAPYWKEEDLDVVLRKEEDGS
jgi:hypothetical protein